MKNKISILAICTMLLLSVFSVIAENDVGIYAVTISSHTANTRIGGNNSVSFSGTYTGNSSGNITVYYNTSIETHTSSSSQICSDITVGAANGTWQCTATNTTFPNDCTGHNLLVAAFNATVTPGAGAAVSINNTANATVSLIWDSLPPRADTFVLSKSVLTIYKNLPYTITATDNCDAQGDLTYRVRAQKPDLTFTRESTGRTSTLSGSDINMIGEYNVTYNIADRANNNATTNSTSDVLFRTKGAGIEEDSQLIEATQIAGAFSPLTNLYQTKKQLIIAGGIGALVVMMSAISIFLITRK